MLGVMENLNCKRGHKCDLGKYSKEYQKLSWREFGLVWREGA